jgi:hypothetical protein
MKSIKEFLTITIFWLLVAIAFLWSFAAHGQYVNFDYSNPTIEVGLYASGFSVSHGGRGSAVVENGPNYGITIDLHKMFGGAPPTSEFEIRNSILNSNPYYAGIDIGYQIISIRDDEIRHRYKYLTYAGRFGLGYDFMYGYVFGKHNKNIATTDPNESPNRNYTEVGIGGKVKIRSNKRRVTLNVWVNIGNVIDGTPFVERQTTQWTTQMGVSVNKWFLW